MEASQARLLWQHAVDSLHATSYQYKFQHQCLLCEQCESAHKYVTIDLENVTDVSYDNNSTTASACAISHPIVSYSEYHTISQWFELLTSTYSDAGSTVAFDSQYGYPSTIVSAAETDLSDHGHDSYHIFCVSFMRNGMVLNSADLNHCAAQHASIADELNNVITSPITTTTNATTNINDTWQLSVNDPNINCGDAASIAAADGDCTQWYYVYMTSGLSVVLSMLTIVCFWLYYRQGLNPATKGYKRSLSYDNGDNDESEPSDSDSMENKKKKHKKKSKKNQKQKKSKSNLFGIDENKQIGGLFTRKANKYGSVAAHSDDDHELKSDALDMDDSERDDWQFVGAQQNNIEQREVHQQLEVLEAPNPFASSASDQTDNEEN